MKNIHAASHHIICIMQTKYLFSITFNTIKDAHTTYLIILKNEEGLQV